MKLSGEGAHTHTHTPAQTYICAHTDTQYAQSGARRHTVGDNTHKW